MSQPTWPLGSHHENLLRELARLIALDGAWRLVRGPVVAATTSDYPDAWDESRDALARVVARTLWHAHVDAEIVLEDARGPAVQGRDYLRRTTVELVHADETRIELLASSLGNDDVAGIVAHEIGRAYVARLAGDHPYRKTDAELPDARIGSIATVALGLGVVAANAAHHDRSAGDTIGRTAYHQHEIAHTGGLDWQDLTFLLAVQATVRDDVLPALDSLRPSQAEDVAAWREVLDDHEAELVALLAIGDVDAETPPARPDEPREVAIHATFDEADLGRANLGKRVFRYSERRTGAFGILGLVAGIVPAVGLAVLLGPAPLNVIPVGIGLLAGGIYGRRQRLHRCATCRSFVTATATECRHCGGTIAGDIKHPNERLDREEELENSEQP